MGERVRRTAGEMGISAVHLDLLEVVHAAAMAPRIARVEAEDPDFLHPGRTALILMQDMEERDPVTLAAAMLVDSERPELRIGDVSAPGVNELAASVPISGESDLLERLVVADSPVQRIALAERLDQLRHAHLWVDVSRRRTAHAEALEVYAPLAARVHEIMSRRYDWWCEMFAKRHLPPGS